ncbi:glycosyltransferase family 2 protein [Thermodesulfobacteriota bacterium]
MRRLPNTSIVIPAYNEAESIVPVLEGLREVMASYPAKTEIIVVDDGSKDHTAEAAAGAGVTVVEHPLNKGYGAAIKTGISRAAHEVIVITDADGTYSNENIPALLDLIEDYDMVVGARTGENVHIPLIRRPAKWVLNVLANIMTSVKIPDLNSGLRAFRKELADRFDHILPDRFSFTTTITLASLTNNCAVKFIPIDYFKRVGRSKIRPIHDTLNFLNLIIKTTVYMAPLRIFLPLSLFLIASGFAKMICYDIILHHFVSDISLVMLLAGIQIGIMGFLAEILAR